ncbi:hypothetical protein ACLKA7_000172 [Drosophila subpalustris]
MHHRTRYNQLRPDRAELEGISQVSHGSQHPLTAGNPLLTPLRKTNYVRAELAPLQRGTTPLVTTRAKRLPTLHGNIRGQLSPRPVGAANGRNTSNMTAATRQQHFLPRVANLTNSVNNNTAKVLKQKKSSAYLSSVCDSSSLNGRSVQVPQQTVPVQLQKMSQPEQQPELPLLSNSNSNSASSSSNDLRKIKLAKAFRLPDEQNKSFVYLCKPVKKVKQLLQAQSLNNSVDNLNDSSQSQELEVLKRHRNRDRDKEAEDLEVRKKHMNRDRDKEELDLKVNESELEVLKRHRNRDRDKEAEDLEVRKKHRNRDRDRDKEELDLKVNESELELRKKHRNRDRDKEAEEMEFVCQNIPTLQREIKLLQQLGEKLEATLRANNSGTPHSSPHGDAHSLYHTPRSQGNLSIVYQLPIVQLGWRLELIMSHFERRAHIVAPRCTFGCAREFRSEIKTLTQLKMAAETECFYLPLTEDGGLQCTTFRQLRENPRVLLEQLKPLPSSKRPFNLLEQDAMFFNSIVGTPAACSLDPLQLLPARESGGGNHYNFPLSTPLFGSPVWTTADVERLLISTVNATVQCEFPPANSASFSRLNSSRRRRRGVFKCPKLRPTSSKFARQVAPLKPHLEPEVQTHLLKTVLVGIVQVAVFLVLIMAFTYPDIRC